MYGVQTLRRGEFFGRTAFLLRVLQETWEDTSNIRLSAPTSPKLPGSRAWHSVGSVSEHLLRALAMAAWPRALHGVSLVHLGPRHFDSLRTNAMKGLRLSKPGASSKIQLSLVDFPTADPGFQALCCSVLDLMCFSCPVQAPQCLDAACTHVGTRAPGPVGVVLERLNAVGTVWDPSCTAFRDCFGIWSPWTSCFSEVKARLVCAWQVAIAAPLQHRAGFAGFASVDPSSYTQARQGPSLGFFYTQAELFHLGQGETNACHFCGQPDSIKRRLLTCPYFNQERQRRATLISKAPELPDCQFLHCWAVRGPEAFSVPSFLVGLPSLVLDFQFVPEEGSTSRPFHRRLLSRANQSGAATRGLGSNDCNAFNRTAPNNSFGRPPEWVRADRFQGGTHSCAQRNFFFCQVSGSR